MLTNSSKSYTKLFFALNFYLISGDITVCSSSTTVLCSKFIWSQIPVATGGSDEQIFCIQSIYLTY